MGEIVIFQRPAPHGAYVRRLLLAAALTGVLYSSFLLSLAGGYATPLVYAVRVEHAIKDLRELTSYSRKCFEPDVNRSARWLLGELREIGVEAWLEEVSYMWQGSQYTSYNVVGEVKGESRLTVLLTAHYDSISWEPLEGRAPGADDDGSGVVAVLEVLRIVRALRLRYTLRAVFFTAEEIGLVGSEAYAKAHAGEAALTVAHVQLDMIGYSHPLVVFAGVKGRPLDDRTMRLAEDVTELIQEAGVEASWELAPYPLSDSYPLWASGIPAVCISEKDVFQHPYFHTPRDTVDNSIKPEVLERSIMAVVNVIVKLTEASDLSIEAAKLAQWRGVVTAPAQADYEASCLIVRRLGGSSQTAHVKTLIGGPIANPECKRWNELAGIEFTETEGGLRLEYPSGSIEFKRHMWRREDYAVLAHIIHEGESIMLLEGCTRYGTYAAALAYVSLEIQGYMAIIHWADSDGDGRVELGELELHMLSG